MNEVKVVTKEIGSNFVKNSREDFESAINRFRLFAHFSQFSDVSRDTKKLPDLNSATSNVRVDSSPVMYPGELLFGVDNDGNMTWLAELIDIGG